MSTATQHVKFTGPNLVPSVHKFRVMLDEATIGQFSNIKLALDKAHDFRRAIVLDVSVQPHRMVYKDGKVLEREAK